MKLLADLLHLLDEPVPPGLGTLEISSLSADSRDIAPGALFCAVRGEKADGHYFLDTAIHAGARVIFCEVAPNTPVSIPAIVVKDLYHKLGKLAHFFYDAPSDQLKIIGVTGTNGKTSTTHYIAQYLHLLGKKVAVLGTVGNGIWGELHPSTHTTPDVFSLHKHLAFYRDAGVEYVAMEVSSHALVQNRVDAVTFHAAVFTNLSRDHLDYHNTMEEYAKAKQGLFQKPTLKYALINTDDANATIMISALPHKARCLLYSEDPTIEPSENMLFVSNIEHAAHETRFKLHSPWGLFNIIMPLLGEFNIANLMAALGILGAIGLDPEALARLSIFIKPVIGRMETIRHPGLPLVVIDFAHTPDALEKALKSLQLYNKHLWIVFGCGGNRDPGKRAQMAQIAEYYAEHVIVTEDNSRHEPLNDIFASIRSGFHYPENVTFIEDRYDAIHYALHKASVEDIILLAGKGHETYLDKNGTKIHFDERAVVSKFVVQHAKK